MNEALERLAREVRLADPANERMRLQFGYACACRVKHFLEDPEVAACLSALGDFLDGSMDRTRFDSAVQEATRLANRHQGSASIDGCGHSAVSSSYAVANALNGKALQAAAYAAYATVYGQAGYAAVQDRESFEPELQWQLACLASLASESSA